MVKKSSDLIPKQSKPRQKKTTQFLKKTFQLLNDVRFAHIISWSNDGRRVLIKDIQELQTSILPKFFKSTKFTSFQRQLHFYHFQKIRKTQNGDNNQAMFEHKYFQKQKNNLLSKEIKQIQRKNRKSKSDYNLIDSESQDLINEGSMTNSCSNPQEMNGEQNQNDIYIKTEDHEDISYIPTCSTAHSTPQSSFQCSPQNSPQAISYPHNTSQNLQYSQYQQPQQQPQQQQFFNPQPQYQQPQQQTSQQQQFPQPQPYSQQIQIQQQQQQQQPQQQQQNIQQQPQYQPLPQQQPIQQTQFQSQPQQQQQPSQQPQPQQFQQPNFSLNNINNDPNIQIQCQGQNLALVQNQSQNQNQSDMTYPKFQVNVADIQEQQKQGLLQTPIQQQQQYIQQYQPPVKYEQQQSNFNSFKNSQHYLQKSAHSFSKIDSPDQHLEEVNYYIADQEVESESPPKQQQSSLMEFYL